MSDVDKTGDGLIADFMDKYLSPKLVEAERVFGEDKLEASKIALRAAHLLLMRCAAQPSRVLVHLEEALENISRGHHQSFLEPQISNRARDTRGMDDFKMFAVIAMEARALQATSVNEAAAWVAKELGKAGFRLPGGRYPKGVTLIGWRKKLKSRWGARSYEEILRLGSDQSDHARFMLDGALKFHAERN